MFAAQPALLGAAVQLPSLGVDMQLGEELANRTWSEIVAWP